MLAADNLNAALAQEPAFQHEHVLQYWDGERALGRLVSRSLALSSPVAWDVYLLYSAGTIWKGDEMPAPSLWMHQLDELPDLHLDPDRLMAEIQKVIEANPKGLV